MESFCVFDPWASPTAITFDAFSVNPRRSADRVLYIKDGGRLQGDGITELRAKSKELRAKAKR